MQVVKVVSQSALILFTSAMLASCERTAGLTLSSKVVKKGSIDFLIERKHVNWYAEITNNFWCRDQANLAPKRGDGYGRFEPIGKKGEGWIDFSGYGSKLLDMNKDDPLSKLVVLDQNAVFLPERLTLTIDGCKTVVRFNLDEGARFIDTMAGKGIRYPESNVQWGDHFLHKFERRPDGGCFEVNTAYVVVNDRFKYCTKDQGKVWYLEKQ